MKFTAFLLLTLIAAPIVHTAAGLTDANQSNEVLRESSEDIAQWRSMT